MEAYVQENSFVDPSLKMRITRPGTGGIRIVDNAAFALQPKGSGFFQVSFFASAFSVYYFAYIVPNSTFFYGSLPVFALSTMPLIMVFMM